MNPEWRARYDEMVLGAQEAGKVALQYFDVGVAVEIKPDDSPVTLADRAAEQSLRDRLAKHFPGDGFLGEEFGNTPSTTGYRWIIDPIDGTRSFIRSIPIWGTLVGLEYRGEIIAGVAYIPAWDQTYRALRGDGAFRGERRIRVSDTAELGKAWLSYSGFGFFKAPGRADTFMNLMADVDRARSYADFYGFLLVAQGSIDLMVDHGVHIWDIAALKAIVEEGGGSLTAWDGSEDLERPDVVASNGKLHQSTLEILKK